jgi:uncharacterized membrane protein YsdA (DUF1294 family)/cold shock CspA family protein
MVTRVDRLDGVLTTWNDERGYGFISPESGGNRVFVHISAFRPEAVRPMEGEPISFEVEVVEDGKVQATRVQRVGLPPAPRPQRSKAARRILANVAVVLAFVLLYLVVSEGWGTPVWVAGIYLVVSAVTFILYGVDKAAAVAGRHRISERALALLGLACGWPGAILGQQLFHHKTRKTSFRRAFWVSVVLNVAAFITLSSPLMTGLQSAVATLRS